MTPAELAALAISWASLLSGYDAPATAAIIEYRQAEFFSEKVCGGAKCVIYGVYMDAEAPETLYILDAFEGDYSLLAISYVIHEATHLLQYRSGEFDSDDCDDSLQRERQAYYVQNEFLVRNGHRPVIKLNHGVCRK